MSQFKFDGTAYPREIAEPLEVRKIVLWYYETNALLRGIQLLDKDGGVLLETGVEF
jgi:hypothetical protein